MRFFLLGPAVLASVVVAGTARADFIFANQPSGTAGHQTGGPYALATDFFVNSPTTVTNLLAFDSGSNGLAANVEVSIFSDTTQAIVPGLDATFLSSGANSTLLTGFGFRALNSFTPILLPAGEYRIVGGNYGATTEPDANTNESNGAGGKDPAPTYSLNNGQISFPTGNHSYYTALTGGATTAYGANSDNGLYSAGSFAFTPEPASIYLLSLGSLTLLTRRRRA